MPVRRHALHGNETLGFCRTRHRVQEQAVHPAKDSRVGADPNTDGENGNSRERTILKKTTQGVTQVLTEHAHDPPALRARLGSANAIPRRVASQTSVPS